MWAGSGHGASPPRSAALGEAENLLDSLHATPDVLRRHGIAANRDGRRRSARELIGYPDVTLVQLKVLWPALSALQPAIVQALENDAHYRGYVERQEAGIAAFRRDEALRLPGDLCFDTVGGLSHEMRQRLTAARPATLGAAGRVPGVTPAALTASSRPCPQGGPPQECGGGRSRVEPDGAGRGLSARCFT